MQYMNTGHQLQTCSCHYISDMGPLLSFQIKKSLAFQSEIKLIEHKASCWRSNVKFMFSVVIWGAMPLADFAPLCFKVFKLIQAIYPCILKPLLESCMRKIFKQDFVFTDTVQRTSTFSITMISLLWIRQHTCLI